MVLVKPLYHFLLTGWKGAGEWITDRVYELTCRLIKLFVDYSVPYLWKMRENQLQKFHLVRCSKQRE